MVLYRLNQEGTLRLPFLIFSFVPPSLLFGFGCFSLGELFFLLETRWHARQNSSLHFETYFKASEYLKLNSKPWEFLCSLSRYLSSQTAWKQMKMIQSDGHMLWQEYLFVIIEKGENIFPKFRKHFSQSKINIRREME